METSQEVKGQINKQEEKNTINNTSLENKCPV